MEIRIRVLSLWFMLLICNAVDAQVERRYDVKIKPGHSIFCLPDNINTAVASGNDVLLVVNGPGSVSKTLSGHQGSVLSIASNTSGDLLLTGSRDKTAILWNIPENQLIQILKGHTKAVTDVSFIDDRTAATIGEDETLRIWDVEKGEVLNLLKFNNEVTALDTNKDLIITGDKEGQIDIRSSDGNSLIASLSVSEEITSLTLDRTGKVLFAGTAKGKLVKIDVEARKITDVVMNKKGDVNDLHVTYDNTHLVVSAGNCRLYEISRMTMVKEINKVASAVLEAQTTPDGQNLFYIENYAPKATSLDISDLNLSYAIQLKDDDDNTPPQLYLSNPARLIDNRAIVYDELLRITGSAIDDYGVQLLKVNGIKTPIQENGNFVINLPLAMGENPITMEVVDVNQNTAIKRFIITRKNADGTEEYDPANAKNYLLVIGINKYDYYPQLYNAVKDANDVVNTLISMYDFYYSDVTLITDEQATRSKLYNTLRSFVGKIGPQDNFMIYYSGHGYFDEVLNEGYWVPSDARINETGDFLSNSDISKIIGSINSQHTFLVADACYSGSLFNNSSRGYAENVERFRSRWGLASGRLEVVSDGSIGQNSPFATVFIDYLKKNNEDKIPVSEIVQHVKIEVAEISDQTPIGNPLKDVGDEGGEFIFYRKGEE